MKSLLTLAGALALGALLCASTVARAQTPAASAASCSPAGDLSFVCGLVNVEDFLPVEGGRWLVGSSLKQGSAGLYLIDTEAKTARPVDLSIASRPDARYAGCTAPDLKSLTTHGLDVTSGRRGTATVYAVNHGGRESVEVFRLFPAKNSAEWVGCVVLPPGASGNAIVALPGGELLVSKFLDTRDKQGMQHVMSGQINGVVYRWRPGRGFSEVPGTRLSGDNGIVVSRDRRWLFVNAYGTHQIYRVPLSRGGKRSSVTVEFSPDNLRWAPDGSIFVTGQFLSPHNLRGPDGWATVRLDPQSMTLTPVIREPGRAEFGDATSTVQIGRTLWFCTFRGDRVAYRPAP